MKRRVERRNNSGGKRKKNVRYEELTGKMRKCKDEKEGRRES